MSIADQRGGRKQKFQVPEIEISSTSQHQHCRCECGQCQSRNPYSRWSRPRCPELVAGSRKQVEVVVMGLTTYRICLRWVTWSWGRSPYHIVQARETKTSSPSSTSEDQSMTSHSSNLEKGAKGTVGLRWGFTSSQRTVASDEGERGTLVVHPMLANQGPCSQSQ